MRDQEKEYERSLILKIKKGDKPAFGKLLHLYNARVYGYFYRTFRHKEQAQDLFQETFLRVWRSFHKYDNRQNFASWIFTIADRVRIDALRSQSVRKSVFKQSEDLDFAGEDNPEMKFHTNELREQIEEAVRSLPEKQRRVFLLRQQAELPFKEIANIMNEPLNSVLSHMHYALKKLRTILKVNYET